MTSQIQITNNQITILGSRTPLFIRIILTFVISICGLIPILVTMYMMIIGDGLHFGLALSIIIFWGLGFYLLRILLWNTYGKEILNLDQNKIQYLADYKLFIDGRQELTPDKIEVEINNENSLDAENGRLRIKNSIDCIEMMLPSRLTDLELIKEKIKSRYNKS